MIDSQVDEGNLSLQTLTVNDILLEIHLQSAFQYFTPSPNAKRLKLIKLVNSTSPGGNKNRGHDDIDSFTVLPFNYATINGVAIKHLKYEASHMLQNPPHHYGTEADVQYHVLNLLRDLQNCFDDLERDITMTAELEFAGQKADIWLLMKSGIPVGAIKINKPGNSRLNDKSLFGQIFDYLFYIRAFYGLPCLFGIITTYNEWRIVWSTDSDGLAAAVDLDSNTINELSIVPVEPDCRRLHCSDIYSITDDCLPHVIIATLRKMLRSATMTKLQMPLFSTEQFRFKVTSEGWKWSRLPKGAIANASIVPASKSCAQFFLLKDYHSGADGRVWLACTAAGNIVVLKFLTYGKGGANDEAMKNEISNWHKMGATSVYSVKLANRFAIVLPFAFHLQLDESNKYTFQPNHWKDDIFQSTNIRHWDEIVTLFQHVTKDVEEALRACVDRFAIKKMVHDDIAWRHVSVLPVFRRRMLIGSYRCVSLEYTFIDLTNVHTVASKREAKASMEIAVDSIVRELEPVVKPAELTDM